ncbi:MAG TPA: AMP-binding protein [Ramlibacter sp.]|nr:AMP-binding protein [Ramlibacter sp.]
MTRPDPHLTLPQRLRHWARTRPDAVALRQKDFGIWNPVSWRGYFDAARSFGLGLMALGLPQGAHVALISENRAEWVYTQLGAGAAGMVTVGIYPTSPAEEVGYLLRAADVQAVVCEDQEQLDKVLAVLPSLPSLQQLVVIDPKGLRSYRDTAWQSFQAVCERGRASEAALGQEIDARIEGQRQDDIALMVFTSGSTGRPKAAMISYGNLNAMAEGSQAIFQCDEHDSMLSYLPLCHVAEQIFTVQLPLAAGCVVNFAESLRTVQPDLREIAPTIFLGVPRIWEKLHSAIHIKMRESSRWKQWLFETAFGQVRDYGSTVRSRWSVTQRLRYGLWYLLVFRALCNFTGLRRCRRALSGAAPIAPDLLAFFRTIGVQITEGYGMTETAGLATVQRDAASPLGTVGATIPGLEARIADDGELLLRGPTIFKGYYRNPQGTAEAIDPQGWLHTGDVAQWVQEPGLADPEVKIVDRKKDIMITAGGKNISPSEIENLLKVSSHLKEVIVVADKRPFVSALIQIDFESVGKWAEEQGLTYTNFRSLAEHPRVRDLVQQEVDRANARMPQVQHVRKFHLLAKELDHDDGEVTATLKIKRASISARYADEIEALYGSARQRQEQPA